MYRRNEVTVADKVTLRCIPCRLIYNPAQYGNKSDEGFRYYERAIGQQLEIVEATDGVRMTKSLLELQCSLA